MGAVVLLAVVGVAVRARYGSGPSAAPAHSAGVAGLAGIAQVGLVLVLAVFELLVVAGLIYGPWRRLRQLGKNRGPASALSRRALLRLVPLPFLLILAQVAVLYLLLRRRSGPAGMHLAGTPHGVHHLGGGIAAQALTQGSLLAAGLLGLGLLLVVLNRQRLRRWLGGVAEQPLAPLPQALGTVVQESLEALAATADPRQAVIAAYVRMERALARQGLPKERAETPLEYLERVLGGLRVSRATLSRLTELFERARFSLQPVDQKMRAEAEGALRHLGQELSG